MNAEALSGKVLGTCTLQKPLGRGGMGAVFLAQQSRPRRQVAVKVLLPISALQPRQRAAFLERFRREADAAASLEHPNIVPVHEYGEQDGLAYLVMAYISGGTLRDELEREGKLSLIQAVGYLDQMADALDFAHERGVIHRDIKPANILLTPDKRLLLTDFGLVKIVTERDQKQLSEAGMPLGTPDYMSPEQVVGREIDVRADLYSLGVILFQMIAGSVPFKGEMPMKVAMDHLHTPPPSPRTLRPDLPLAAEAVILRALAKKPEDRYAHTRDFANAFRQALEAAGVVLADAPGSTAAVRAMKIDRSASNRPRGLFDPVWRGQQEQNGRNGQQSPPMNNLPQEETAKLAAKQGIQMAGATKPVVVSKGTAKSLREQQKQVSEDIVAKTSMTLPSFSGILSQTMSNQPVSSLLTAQSALITSSKDTPLPDINMMENQPTNELPRQNNQPAKDVHARSNAPTRNSLLSPNRLRPERQANLPGEEQGSQTNTTNGLHNPNATRQLNMDSTGNNATQGISPRTNTTGMLNPNGKTRLLRSYAINNTKLVPDTQAAPDMPNVPNLSHSTRQLNPLPDASANGNGPNYAGPSGSAGSTGALGTAQQNSYQPGSTGTFNNFDAQASMAGTTGSFNLYNPAPGTTGVWKTQTGALIPVNAPGTTGSFMIPSGNESTGQTGMLKLTQPVKVIKVPLAGQPGQYVTGLLPVLPSSTGTGNDWSGQQGDTSLKGRVQKNLKVLILLAAVVVILFGSVIFLISRPSTPTVTKPVVRSAQANKAATAAAQASKIATQATATAQANLIVNDPLDSNAHGWLNGNDKVGNNYSFQKGAYHVKVANNQNEAAVALLPSPSGLDNFVYTISLNEVTGLDNSTDAAKVNTFGVVLRFTINGSNPSYYAFLIDPNSAKPTYEFQKYDMTHENNNDPRTSLWSGSIGGEYHLNHGANNIIKITANGAHFNFNVNGKDVGSKDDNSFGAGQVGMIVNLDGTEIAFSNLLLTHQ